jgi:hypothetical protein
MLSRYDNIRVWSVGSWMEPNKVPGANTSTLASGRSSSTGAHSISSGTPAAAAVPVAHVRSPPETAIECAGPLRAVAGSPTVALTSSPS